MQAYRCQTQIDESGQLQLSHLPFRPGDEVEVIVLPRTNDDRPEDPYPLRGLPYRYDRPTDPVAEDDWDALK
jgi:hypothetical protein